MDHKNMITVYVTDKSQLLIDSFCSSLNQSGVAHVIETCHTLKECRKKLESKTPDLLPNLLLLSPYLPDGNGVNFCSEILKKYPAIKVMVLITYQEYEDYSIVQQAMNNGASGYMLKNAEQDEVISEIKSFVKNIEDPVWFSPYEEEMLMLMRNGHSDMEIAIKFKIHEGLIDVYRNAFIQKLFAIGKSNHEIEEQVNADIDLIRKLRVEFIEKVGAGNSMNLATSVANVIITLTPVEKILLELIAIGCTNIEIAEKLKLSEDTVKTYRRDLILKFGAKNTMTMVIQAFRMGLITLKEPLKKTYNKKYKK